MVRRPHDLLRGLLAVRRQTYPGRGGLVTEETKGRRRRPVPIIEPLRATLEPLTVGRARDARLLVGPRGEVITTATLRDATGWDELVDDLGLAGLVRHRLRHTALTWMADAGVECTFSSVRPAIKTRRRRAVIFTRITRPCSMSGRRTRAGGPNLGSTPRR
jgi:integrase